MTYDHICKRLRQLAYNDNLRYASRPNADGTGTECDKLYTNAYGAQSLQRLGVSCQPVETAPEGYKLDRYTYQMDPYQIIAHGLDTVSEETANRYLPKKVKDMMNVLALTDELNGERNERSEDEDNYTLSETLERLKMAKAIRYVPATDTQPMSILVQSNMGKELRRKMVKTARLTQMGERFLQGYDIGDCDRRVNVRSLLDNSRFTDDEKVQLGSWLETVQAPVKNQVKGR